MIKKEFGVTLSELCKASSKSRKEISLESGVSYRFIEELIKGEKQPSIKTLFNLAAALDVTACDLVSPTWEKWCDAGQPEEPEIQENEETL